MTPPGMTTRYPLLPSHCERRYALCIHMFLHCRLTNFQLQGNIFDTLLALSVPKLSELCDELNSYLSTDPEHVIDALAWWVDKCTTYPHLSRMALDYLTIPSRSYFVEPLLTYILTGIVQQHLLMLSGYSVVDGSFFRMCAVGSQSS